MADFRRNLIIEDTDSQVMLIKNTFISLRKRLCHLLAFYPSKLLARGGEERGRGRGSWLNFSKFEAPARAHVSYDGPGRRASVAVIASSTR